MTDADSQSLLALAREAAAAAGDLISRMRAISVDVADTKSSVTDVVTEADRASEALIRSLLEAERPGDGFHGEEGDDVPSVTGVRWIVDPIDGTVNYLYGIPQYAVSIAAEVDGRVVAGVVLNPVGGEEFSAVAHGGAYLNGERLQVRPPGSLAQALVATGFGYEADVRALQAAALARLLTRVRDIRRAGSCALDLCGVAAGRLDAYVETGPHYWDYAAGALVLTEAGGRFERRINPTGRNLLIGAARDSFDQFVAVVMESGYDVA